MTELLLITDIPRLRKVFSRLSDEQNIRLRVVTNLEKGGEEIVAEKPAMIFVQTHLSGFSADILLNHLKKQLGRKRSRFVLLSSPDQVTDDVIKLFHDRLDTSLDDNQLFDQLMALVASLQPKGRKTAAVADNTVVATEQPVLPEPQADMFELQTAADAVLSADLTHAEPPPQPTPPVALSELPAGESEPSLEEQGVVYAPRQQISVYSEFTSSFDSAVGSMPDSSADENRVGEHAAAWEQSEPETVTAEAAGGRPKWQTYLFWALPVFMIVVVITLFQHRKAKPVAVSVIPGGEPPAVVKVDSTATGAATAAPQAKPPVEADARLSDKAVITAIAANRNAKERPANPGSARISTLPDFIPRGGLDKGYAQSNPGWERYMGQVTEFKVFREGQQIKAIQIIDRGGNGVPESFMKAAIGQLTRNPAFVQASTEKKEGYEIQRGQVADNLKVVYYRDADGGKLRAFVVTWQ